MPFSLVGYIEGCHVYYTENLNPGWLTTVVDLRMYQITLHLILQINLNNINNTEKSENKHLDGRILSLRCKNLELQVPYPALHGPERKEHKKRSFTIKALIT